VYICLKWTFVTVNKYCGLGEFLVGKTDLDGKVLWFDVHKFCALL
jgi:hypothetical protein